MMSTTNEEKVHQEELQGSHQEQNQKICMTEVFPSSKIKSMLRQEEQIGRIYTSAVEIVGMYSVICLCLFSNF